MMISNFSFERLGLLMRADLMQRGRSVLIVSGTLTILMVLHGLASVNSFDPGTNIYGLWLFGMLFVWAPIVASYSFRELHDKAQNEGYLLLPASALEKAVARLLLATVVFGTFVLVFLTVASWLVFGVVWMLAGESVPTFAASDFISVRVLGQALVTQSIFFLGAAWFRKSHFIKTSLAFTIAVLGLVAFAAFLLWSTGFAIDAPGFFGLDDGFLNVAGRIGQIVYFAILPPFCWWVAWLRVREAQVSYGV